MEVTMDWDLAIERNREALKRILAALIAMAGLAGGGTTLPRRLHRAVTKLLRPAEAAARRLIIVAARGLVVDPPRFRPAKPKPVSMEPLMRQLGLAVVLSTAELRRAAAKRRAAALRASRPRKLSFPLLDPLTLPRSFFGRPARRYRPRTASVPRIIFLGSDERRPVPPPPSPYDPVSAVRLALRLQALGRALDDLPGQALRFARWQAGRDARVALRKGSAAQGPVAPRRAGRSAQGRFDIINAQNGKRRRGPYDRTSPLKPGHPPGWRRKSTHEVHEVLKDLQYFAVHALEKPDTS
jgi:hypothetical protein